MKSFNAPSRHKRNILTELSMKQGKARGPEVTYEQYQRLLEERKKEKISNRERMERKKAENFMKELESL